MNSPRRDVVDVAGRAARNTVIVATLADAVCRCSAVGMRTLPLKGGALLASGIVARHERHLDDLDLWVEPGRARDAYDLLVAAGYQASPSSTHAGLDTIDAPTHQLPVLHSPLGAVVELHLESHGAGEAGSFDVVHGAGADVVVSGVVVRVPSPRHLLEQLCGHVVVHHAGDVRYWPRHIDDVRRLVATEPTLMSLRSRADAVGLSLRVLHGVEAPGSADAILSRLFVDPSPSVAAAFRAAALGLRAARFIADGPKGFGRVLVPAPSHLQFTGDLVDDRLARAHLRRWRRILGRLR